MAALVLLDKNNGRTEIENCDLACYDKQRKGFFIIREEKKLHFEFIPGNSNSTIYHISARAFSMIPEILTLGNQKLTFGTVHHPQYGKCYKFSKK